MRVVAVAGIATPSFWLGIMSIVLVLDITYLAYRQAVDAADHVRAALAGSVRNLSILIWPAPAAGYRYSAVAIRMTRSAMLEVLREDYIRTARAKGLIERSSSTGMRSGTRCCR